MRKVTLAIVNIIAIFCITLCITTDAFSKGTFTQYEKEYSLNEILIGKHIVIGLHKTPYYMQQGITAYTKETWFTTTYTKKHQ